MEGLFLGLGYLANYVKAELLVAEGSYAICAIKLLRWIWIIKGTRKAARIRTATKKDF